MKQPLNSQGTNVRAHTWTDEDIIFIQENAGKLTADEIAQHIGVAKTALKTKAYKHGVSLRVLWRPTKDVVEQVFTMSGEKVPSAEIASKVGLTISQVTYILRTPCFNAELQPRLLTAWSDENTEKLLELATKMPARDIAALLSVKVNAVRSKARLMGISLKFQAFDQWDINMTHALRKPPSPLKHAEIAEKLELSLTDIKKILRSYKPEDSHASF
ncbi:MAG: hypothetical protein RR987_16510 [Hafnia sp.]|uniref:hypothetical protein n=1 Tax=Hafnia sp. TaxID=1873498 RepID=UPI002FCA1E04